MPRGSVLALILLFSFVSPSHPFVAPLVPFLSRPSKGATARSGVPCLPALRGRSKGDASLLPLRSTPLTGEGPGQENREEEYSWQKDDSCLDEFANVHDPKSNKNIMCFVDQAIKIDGSEYKLGYPVDTPVLLAYFDDNDDLLPAEGEEERQMYSEAEAALALKNCELIDSAVVLTVRGELDEEEEEIEGEKGDEERLEGEEYVRVLTPFQHQGRECYVVEPLQPVVLVFTEAAVSEEEGKKVQQGILVIHEEVARLMPHFERELAARFDKML